ncbi:MAG: chloride channel protein [Thermodesulfobacteriota bacterium]
MKRDRFLRYPARWAFFRGDDRPLMIVMAMIVGVGSGLAALALNGSLTALFNALRPYRHAGWAFLFPAFGAMLSALFLEKIMRESPGHGVPEVIDSVMSRGGKLRFRSGFSRLVAACLTIGSGGSAGPEAPVVISGSSIGSNVAGFFALNERQRITLVGCGAAGAIASIFNAPIAGMIFAVEVIIGQWSSLNIIPVAVAAVAGTEISRRLQGNQIVFSHRVFAIGFGDFMACIGLAVLTALVSVLLTRLLRGMQRFSHGTGWPLWCRAWLGGAAVGGMAVLFPDVLGEGYHAVDTMIAGRYAGGFALAGVMLLAKILATGCTLGWGGSGGIFAPCLVIGSFSGLFWQRMLVVAWPAGAWVEEGCFALIGMAGMIGGMLQAPLTGIFLIVEITGGYDAVLPLILVSSLSTVICRYIEPASFYLKDLVETGRFLLPGTDGRVLADLSVEELLEKDCLTVHPGMLLRDFIPVIRKSRRNLFPVAEEGSGRFLGMIHLDDVRPFLFDTVMYDTVLMEQVMRSPVETAGPEDNLADILKKMDTHHLFSLPVVKDGRFIGMLSKATLLDQYRKELRVQTDD